MSKITLLAQVIQLLPAEKFKKLANELQCNKHSKGIDSWTHLVTMLFCHLSNAVSCRDISIGLMSIAGSINHLGCKQAPSKSSVFYNIQMLLFAIIVKLYVYLRWNKPTFNLKYNVGIG